jgi:hypothetical protein
MTRNRAKSSRYRPPTSRLNKCPITFAGMFPLSCSAVAGETMPGGMLQLHPPGIVDAALCRVNQAMQ